MPITFLVKKRCLVCRRRWSLQATPELITAVCGSRRIIVTCSRSISLWTIAMLCWVNLRTWEWNRGSVATDIRCWISTLLITTPIIVITLWWKTVGRDTYTMAILVGLAPVWWSIIASVVISITVIVRTWSTTISTTPMSGIAGSWPFCMARLDCNCCPLPVWLGLLQLNNTLLEWHWRIMIL